jgi:hypothetical protein
MAESMTEDGIDDGVVRQADGGRGAPASRPRCKGVVSWGHVDTVTRGPGEMLYFSWQGGVR